MDETDVTRVEGNAYVRVGSWCSVLEVSLYDTAHAGELAADLMVTASEELYLNEIITFRGPEIPVAQAGEFRFAVPCFRDERLVHLLVAHEPVFQLAFRR